MTRHHVEVALDTETDKFAVYKDGIGWVEVDLRPIFPTATLNDISRQIRALPTTFGPGIPINDAALLEREAVASFIDEVAG